MHRSGTSLVARIVNLLGIDLGPRALLLPPRPDNPRGFWEHAPFTALNDAVLAAMGGTWDQPPPLPAGWHRAPELRSLRNRARRLVRSRFGKTRRWGWKDPRSSLTLPFWRSVLPRLRFIVCLRNPLDVSRSLERRNALPIAKGEALWMRYTQDALANTTGGERLLVFYEDLLMDAKPQLRRVAAFLGARPPRRLAAAEAPALGGVDPSLRHQRSEPAEVFVASGLSFASQALYAVLRSHAASGSGRPGGLPPAVLNRFAARCQQEGASELEREGLRRELHTLKEAAAARENTVEELAKAIVETERTLDEVRMHVAHGEDERDALRRSLRASEGEARRLREDQVAQADRISELEGRLQDRTADLQYLRNALETAASTLIGARSALRVRDQEVERLEATLRAITHSKAYPLLRAIWAAANVLAPVRSRRERIVNALFRATGRTV
jgi:predicted  nucleic acid-binding Zn-ribbon protein